MIIKRALEGLEGVEKTSISYKTKMGEVLFNPNKVTPADILNRVNQIGFKAKMIEE